MSGDGADRTQRLAGDRERIKAMVRSRLRSGAAQIAAECERLLDELHQSDRRAWKEALGQALIAARRIVSLTAPWVDAAEGEPVDDTLQPNARILAANRAILSALGGLPSVTPASAVDEIVLRGLHGLVDQTRAMLADPVRELAAAERPAPAGASEQLADRRFRVLVADDDHMIRGLLDRALSAMGYEVALAENGVAALEAARRGVDLILTDINMPEMDGIALLRELKRAESTRDIPVIVISSQNDLHSVADCIEAGAEDHLAKPWEMQILRARVVACLERKRLRDFELTNLRRVSAITAAAEAVERDAYVAGSLKPVAVDTDALGQLARVFDRMVSGIQLREERLRQHVQQLQRELQDSAVAPVPDLELEGESPFKTGEVLASRYEIHAHIGSGGMGMVYRARDLELGEDVAVKVVRRDIVKEDPTILERLKSEIRLARKISHRNVVRAHDLGEWKGVYFITMEYVRGLTVSELLQRRGRLSVESTLAVGTQLCEALAVAHEQSIVHRDIKPANLLLDPDGVLKVMDFGIARSVARGAKGLTAGGFVVGTPHYMAPELLMGRTADARTDLFAAGVVLYECLTGQLPFSDESPQALLSSIHSGTFAAVSARAPDVPPRLEAIVHQQLRYDPAERVGSARELATKLAEIDSTAT